MRRTCSVGWAPFPWYPDSTRTFAFTEVLKIADRAMYRGKETTRNVVYIASHDLPPVPAGERK